MELLACSAGLPSYLDNVGTASPESFSAPSPVSKAPEAAGSSVSSSSSSSDGTGMSSFANSLSGGPAKMKESSFMPKKSTKPSSGAGLPTYLDNMGSASGATFTTPPVAPTPAVTSQPPVLTSPMPASPSSTGSGAGMTSFADALSGNKSGGNSTKKSSFMPKSYRQPSTGAGLPSYLDNMKSAESFTPLPASSPVDASTPPQQPEAAAAPASWGWSQPKKESASTSAPRGSAGMPSYMDNVAKSYVAGSDRLEELKKDISSMESKQKSSSPEMKARDEPEELEEKKEAGLPSFLASFFGKGKKKTEEKKPTAARYQESADGSFLPQTSQTSQSGNTAGTVKKDKPVETAIPTISSWAQTPEGSIHGFIYGSPNFEDGAYIITTPVGKGAQGGNIVTTASGSQYRLSMEQNSYETVKST